MRWLLLQGDNAKDMASGKESFYDKIGFSSDHRRIIKRAYLWKSKATVTILCFAVVWVIFHTFEKPSEKPKSRRSKRHLETQTFGHNRKISAQDVYIIPEQLGLHYNRNSKSPGKWKILKNVKIGGERGGSGYIMSREKTEEETKLAKGLISSMRLKGIYMQSMRKEGNHLEEKFNYSKEINNLIEKGFGSETKDEEWTFEGGGADFKLPRGKKRHVNPKGHPITIYLDFYPMKDSLSSKKSSQTEGEGKGMIMKLNLYPRKRGMERHAGREPFGWLSQEERKETNGGKES